MIPSPFFFSVFSPFTFFFFSSFFFIFLPFVFSFFAPLSSCPWIASRWLSPCCPGAGLARHWMQHIYLWQRISVVRNTKNMLHSVSLTTPSSSRFCLRLVKAKSDASTLVGLVLGVQSCIIPFHEVKIYQSLNRNELVVSHSVEVHRRV